jgi:hypothetical protein
MYKLLLPTALLALAACQSEPAAPVNEMVKGQSCSGTEYQHLIGQPGDKAQSIQGPLRVLNPGDMMTRDLREDRTNVFLDDSGVIERITCG